MGEKYHWYALAIAICSNTTSSKALTLMGLTEHESITEKQKDTVKKVKIPKKFLKNNYTVYHRRKVIRLRDKKVFESVEEASKKEGLTRNYIKYRVQRKNRTGLKDMWLYLEDYKKIYKEGGKNEQ